MDDEDTLLGRPAASEFLRSIGIKCAPATLAKLACTGQGPTMTIFGSHIGYRKSDLREWAESRLIRSQSTSETSTLRANRAGRSF
jgi:hypothetical protein